MQMRQRDVAALDAKYTKELVDAKAENDVGVMMLPLVVVATHQSSLSVMREATIASGVDGHAASPDWQTLLNGIISPSESILITMQKQLEGTQKHINEQQIERLYRWATHAIIVSNTHALPAEYKNVKVIKLSTHLRMFAVSVLTTFSAGPNLPHRQFSCLNSRNEEMMADGFWCYCRFVLNSKRSLSTSCNKQGQRSRRSSIFSWCYSRCFLKFAESYEIKQT